MISKSYITKSLEKIDRLFQKTTDLWMAEHLSKLAVIELSGWIEESFDSIVRWYYKRNLKSVKNKEECENVIKQNFGFNYSKNIRPMFYKVIGFANLEKVENKANTNIDVLKAILGNIKKMRDKAAHTHIKKVTRQFDAPSKVIGDFRKIYKAVKAIEEAVKNI